MSQSPFESKHTLYLVDISSFIFRAFYGIRGLKNSKGEPTNAVYGVASMMARLWQDAKPEHMAVVYDSKEPSFRKEIYTEYKANRSAPPDDLIPQFDWISDLIEAFEIYSIRQSGVEADDLIASLTVRWTSLSPKNRVIIVSSDKDLMQLVNPKVMLWDTMADKFYNEDQVLEKFQVPPSQIRDYLAIVGDSSDNIPGVAGIGPKGAVELLKKYKNLDGVLKAAADEKVAGKKGQTLRDNKDKALLSQVLITLKMNLADDLMLDHCNYSFKVTPKLVALLKRFEFHGLIKRWHIEHTSAEQTQAQTKVPAQTTPNLSTLPTQSKKIRTQTQVDLEATPSSMLGFPSQFDPKDVGSYKSVARFRYLNEIEDLKDLCKLLMKKGELAFDLETTSLNPRQAEIVGLSFSYDTDFGVYIPVSHRGFDFKQLPLTLVLKELSPVLSEPRIRKVGQNIKYDISVLKESCGIEVQGIGGDTMIASYILSPEGRHGLDTLAKQHFEYETLTFEAVCGKGKDQITFDLVDPRLATRYSAEDAWMTLKLWKKFIPLIHEQALTEVLATLDVPLIKVLSEMELQGVFVDVLFLKNLSGKFDKELLELVSKIGTFTKNPINLNSPKQLGHFLFEELKLPTQSKTKTGFSTDASVLDALAPLHEVPRLLLEYREITKLKNTYIDTLPTLIDLKTKKIHTHFHQTIAATGRLSCTEPNLQNIPIRTKRGQLIRQAFIASPDCILLSADYSQIELRLLAHMSEDQDLVKSFNEGADVHTRTAADIYGVPPESVTKTQRSAAKAVNFGLMYGKTAFGLSLELGITRREAQDTIDRYFARYHGVKRYLDSLIEVAKTRGYALTLFGRKRFLPDLNAKNGMQRANAERMAMNTPIQGTAADLMKLAMIELYEALNSFKSKMIIQVHDEIVLDCLKTEIDEVEQITKRVLEGAMKLKVPLTVNTSRGNNWLEA